MPGFNPEQINIHDLTIEEPEKKQEVFFDPEKDITEDEWGKILLEIENQDKNTRYGKKMMEHRKAHTYLDYYPALKILGRNVDLPPEKFNEIMENKLELMRKENQWDRFLDTVSSLAVLDIPSKIHDADKTHIKEFLESRVGSRDFIKIASLCRIAGLPVQISEDQWQEINSDLEKIPGEAAANIDSPSKESLTELLAAKKIMGGKVDTNNSYWSSVLKSLLKGNMKYIHSGDNLDHFLKLAKEMAILSAEEIHIPDGGGLELTMPERKEIDPETPIMPENRKF